MEIVTKKVEVEQEKFSSWDIRVYMDPPDQSVSLQEFEDFAVARLKLLRILERAHLTCANKDSKEWKEKVYTEIDHAGLLEFIHLLKGPDPENLEDYKRGRKWDRISHYVLRLAFCRTEELRRWFVTWEIELFRYKCDYSSTGIGNDAKLMLDACFQNTVTVLEDKDKDKILPRLKDTYFSVNEHDVGSMDVYEVPFTTCLELVRTRKVYLKGGKAYIFHNQLLTIVCSEFRAILSKDLVLTSKIMGIVDEDERLANILSDFDKRHTGSSYGNKQEGDKSVVTVEKLEDTIGSFPLCAKSMYEHVKKEFHLKHFGRLQLGLFFKGAGVPVEESVRFWRTYFTKKQGVDENRFDKQYLYNIRHMYGQEGKRADYTPYSCMKIIMSSVGPGENHGCPFRHSDGVSLRVRLAEANIPATGVKEIMELVDKQHYQIACQKYFEWTHHKATIEGGVNHPNQYYKESITTIAGSFKVKTEAAPTHTVTRVNVFPKKEIKEEADWTMELEKDDMDDCFLSLDDSVVEMDTDK